jgi:hypothetical protein
LRTILSAAVELRLAWKDSFEKPCTEAVSEKPTAIGTRVEDAIKCSFREQPGFDRGTAEELPGIDGLKEGERGSAREFGHHEGVAKVIGSAASAPLDTGNAALGVSRRHKVHRQDWGVEHECGGGVSGLVWGNAIVAVNMYVEDGPMALLELRNVAKFLVPVARVLSGNRAPGESVSRLHTAQAVGDHHRDRVRRSGEVVMKGGKFGFVGMALKGIRVDV